MPISHRMQLDDIKGVKKLVDGPSGKFAWRKLKNVYVPTRIEISRRIVEHVNHVKQEGDSNMVLDFHWFSFNDPKYTNPDMEDGKCFESKEKFFSLLDPVKAGADFVNNEQVEKKQPADKKPVDEKAK